MNTTSLDMSRRLKEAGVELPNNRKWKSILGYEGLCYISDFGEVISIKRKGNCKTRMLKSFLNGHKRAMYYTVMLNKNNKGKPYRVHRLVAEHFLRKPKFATEVHHKDHNKLNNNVNNLEWVTGSQNRLYDFAKGIRNTKGDKNPRAILTEREVKLLRYLKGLYQEIKPKDIAKFYGVKTATICQMFNMRRWIKK